MARTAAAVAAASRGCAISGCQGKHKGRGLCGKHLQRLRLTGSTADPVRPTFQERFWVKVDRRGPNDCWPWTAAVNEHGYGVMRPPGKRTGPAIKAHRVSAEFAGMAIDGLDVLHSCDNPPCVNPAHLRTGTAAENSRDMVRRWRSCYGERQNHAKLTEAQVLEIRERRAAGEMRNALAAEFGVSGSTISNIANGQTWRHLSAVSPQVGEWIGRRLRAALHSEVAA